MAAPPPPPPGGPPPPLTLLRWATPWAYFHIITDPDKAPIAPIQLGQGGSRVAFKRKLQRDFARPWIPLGPVGTQRIDPDPYYRLAVFIHQHKAGGSSRKDDVYSLSFYDRELNQLHWYDTNIPAVRTMKTRAQRLAAVQNYWANVAHPFGVLPPLTVHNNLSGWVRAHDYVRQPYSNKPRLTIYACMTWGLQLMNNIEDRSAGFSNLTDVPSEITGMQRDYLPWLFVHLFRVLREKSGAPNQQFGQPDRVREHFQVRRNQTYRDNVRWNILAYGARMPPWAINALL
ncbi:hypothetical protein F5B20DRAFT_579835 [Whalleya microplaca]|nr:hypothetical protein F5B20DRAFT_579835 [Whalleya microplaca]